MQTFFFDTYAFHELIVSNENYKPYSDVSIITTKLNLMELYYTLLLKYGREAAEKYFDEFISYTIEIDDDIFKKACEFKLSNKNKRLSYVDCIGYILAKSRNVKFLTGDKEFKYLENVEFAA